MKKQMIKTNKVIVVDVDGTLTLDSSDRASYADKVVNEEMRVKLWSLKAEDYWIVLYTSRNMRSYSGNTGLIAKHTLPALIEWLNKHDVPFDELHMGKPWCGTDGFYVDDRAIRPKEFLALSIEQIRELLRKDAPG